ncbi:14-3-3 protein 8 isoform X2 [Oopsacas minuta]|uniref:14-3-3 protein 8 isoform X2 n=1 Tax=Oopsacas minuta TaxID=111878 RepID=A0AAV7JZB8_9METZ|nr:14-3-3 protein 8 isoform X2 [Oopsacas minuta]
MSEEAIEERQRLVYQARLSEHCERYDDMVEAMKCIALKFSPMEIEERNLMSVGYKNVVGQRRTALRTFRHMLEMDPGSPQIIEYIKRVEYELDERCNEIISDILSDEFINTKCVNTKDKVFYLKMKGDYYRYMAEYKKDEARDSVAQNSLKAYNEALDKSIELEHTDTIKLGLALNFSVFYYEIMKKQSMAIDLAKKSFDEALASIDQLQDSEYKDATLILQLLRDNLTLWNNEIGEPADEVNGDPPAENDVDEK